MSDEDRTSPLLAEAVGKLVDAKIAEIHTCLPAVVVSYDAALERADVQPLLRRTYLFPDGRRQVYDLPQIQGAPVRWPRFGGWVIRGELAPGDIVELKIAERSLERWLAAQDRTRPIEPGDSRRHDLSDGIVEPGLVPSTATGLADLTIGRVDGTNLIRMTAAGEIHLAAGGDTDQAMVRGEELLEWLARHTHPTAFGPSGAPLEPIPETVLSSGARLR